MQKAPWKRLYWCIGIFLHFWLVKEFWKLVQTLEFTKWEPTTEWEVFKVYEHMLYNGWWQIQETDSKMAAANSFTVYAGNRLLVVAASSEVEKNKWMEDLQMVIDNPRNRLDSTEQLHYASIKSTSEL